MNNHCRTVLLVTDDPDDHHAISEAIADISDDTVVLNVLDSQQALKLLKSKMHTPDYLFLDLSMHGIKINSFVAAIKSDEVLNTVPTVLYGEHIVFSTIERQSNVVFFNKDYDYSELKVFLSTLIKPKDGQSHQLS
jgi:CheY-like chemotaxis protein